MNVRHLRNPPITEAIFDLRANLPSDVGVSDLEKFGEMIRDQYPKKKIRRRFESEHTIEEGGISKEKSNIQPDGFLFLSEDEKRIVQYRLDGFTYNKLKPYINWDEIFPEVQRVWKHYHELVKPVLITRTAVRYINSIDLPFKEITLERYFTCPPKIPEGLPQDMTRFLLQTITDDRSSGIKAIVTMNSSPPNKPDHTTLVLDIDIFKESSWMPGDADCWDVFKEFRALKNKIFFSYLTEEAIMLFE